MRKTKRLLDEYRFPGFRPVAKIKGKFGDSQARIIPLKRSQKKQPVPVVEQFIKVITIAKHDLFVICHVVASVYIWKWTYAALSVISMVK
jgi:hypothetical protein